MRRELKPIRVADDVFEIAAEDPQEAQAIADGLRAAGRAEDVVAGLDRVAVRFQPDRAGEIERWLELPADLPSPQVSEAEIVEIGVVYGGAHGPDLARVGAALDLSEDALIKLHTSRVHTVEMMGFTPGFAYLSGLPGGMAIPRLDNPRARVAAGTIGVSRHFTGLYSLEGPGGWPLIGHTPEPLFQPDSDDPFRLKAGQRVRFRAL